MVHVLHHSVQSTDIYNVVCCCVLWSRKKDLPATKRPHALRKAKEEKQATNTFTAPAPAPKLTYLPNLQNALKCYMHTKHRLGYAVSKTGYYSATTLIIRAFTTREDIQGMILNALLTNQFKQLGLDHQHTIKLARKLHARSVKYANKFVTTASRRAIVMVILPTEAQLGPED
eukprot:1157908-Pelagomonas_calceolata.AAC.5